MRERYKEKVTFIVLYQREAHPNQMSFSDIDQPKKYEERKHLAQRTCDDLYPETAIVIDEMDDAVRLAYGRLPNSAYIVDKGGKIVYKEDWANIEGWAEILDGLLEGGR